MRWLHSIELCQLASRHDQRAGSRPFRRWFRALRPDFAAELSSEKELRANNYFDPVAVKRLRADLIAGHDTCEPPLMAVLAEQLWDDSFIRDLHCSRPASKQKP
jgi:hypothetical protein